MATILVSTADLEAAAVLRAALETDHEVRFVSGPHEAREALDVAVGVDAALILTGAVRDSDSLVSAASKDARPIPVVALFDEGEAVPTGLTAQLQIDEMFVKPFDAYEVALVLPRLIRHKRLQSEIGIVGNSEPIHEVIERIAQIAPVVSTVLITGESGTGKELVARGLHKLSPRRGKPFIAVNIAALPETLLESELFGHEKDSFTGANSRRKGMFELANSGTIFLDEVAEMPLGSQTKLLRVLEQREFMRVGGSEPIRVDVRVIAATNKDLQQGLPQAAFRRDLYYRLDVLRIRMPPLREHRGDIPLLVHEFIREFSDQHQREFKGIAPEALDILVRHDWPGNVRELRNLVESMVVLAPGSTVRPQDIPPEVRRGTGGALAPQFRVTSPLVPKGDAIPVSEGLATQLPEVEFIFRTLVELKYDVDDLRREFEMYKRRHPELTGPREAAVVTLPKEASVDVPRAVSLVTPEPAAAETNATSQAAEDAVAFRPGMTMQEIERAAIIATLKDVGGNRRRASEKLEIGERTLYRKIKEYDIDA